MLPILLEDDKTSTDGILVVQLKYQAAAHPIFCSDTFFRSENLFEVKQPSASPGGSQTLLSNSESEVYKSFAREDATAAVQFLVKLISKLNYVLILT